MRAGRTAAGLMLILAAGGLGIAACGGSTSTTSRPAKSKVPKATTALTKSTPVWQQPLYTGPLNFRQTCLALRYDETEFKKLHGIQFPSNIQMTDLARQTTSQPLASGLRKVVGSFNNPGTFVANWTVYVSAFCAGAGVPLPTPS